MRIELQSPPEKILEVVKPDGNTVRLKIRKLTVAQTDEFERKEQEYQARVKSKDITNTEYILSAFERICEDFNREDIKDLDMDQVNAIFQAIQTLQRQKEEPEKKSR